MRALVANLLTSAPVRQVVLKSTTRSMNRTILLAIVLGSSVGHAAADNSYDFSGSAFVGDDGVMRIAHRDVHLWGIVIPPTREQCLDYIRPPDCGPRATLALKESINGFVGCRVVDRNVDGSVSAQCFTGYSSFDAGVDLAAYLLNRGWALAAPDASPEYQALERIARHTGLGLWGSPRAVLP